MDAQLQQQCILVTGVSGHVGGAIVKGIAQKYPTFEIIGWDIVPPPKTIQNLLLHFHKVDITKLDQVQSTLQQRQDLIIHTAALVPSRALRYSRAESQWEEVKASIYGGTKNLVTAALDNGCHNIIYTSSVTAVIDDIEHDFLNIVEDSTTSTSVSLHYGRAKILAENHLLSAPIRSCILRLCPVLGPEDRATMGQLHEVITNGETGFIVGSGDNLCDFMYIDNAVDAHILAMENLLTTGTAVDQVFSITNHEPVYFWDLLTFVWAQYGHYPPYRVHIPTAIALAIAYILGLLSWLTGKSAVMNPGNIKDGTRSYFSNTDKASAILGYHPTIGLSEGVRRSCEGYKRFLKDQ